MAPTRNIIGLDVGSRRIGVAIANFEARIASPFRTIDRLEDTDIFSALTALFEENNVATVVVGLPRNMEGNETAQTVVAREFAAELEKVCKLQVHLQDEAATSVVAEDELKARQKPYQKGDIDKLAATYILSDWLLGQTQELGV
jgi:putative holliday junction resolvase